MKKRLVLPIAATGAVRPHGRVRVDRTGIPDQDDAVQRLSQRRQRARDRHARVGHRRNRRPTTSARPAADAIAVFDGSTKVVTFSATSGAVLRGRPARRTRLTPSTGPGTADGVGLDERLAGRARRRPDRPGHHLERQATYVTSAAIKLTATDAGSGVAATYYKLDGGAQVTGTSITVTARSARTRFEFWSVDVAGNIEAAQDRDLHDHRPGAVDTTAPVTTSDAEATYVTAAAITLTATDAGSGVAATYYKLDGGAQAAGTSITVDRSGAHTLEFWSVDVAGNIETRTRPRRFTITAPVASTPPLR